MKELDELMNVILSDIIGNSRLPKIEIEEPDANANFRVNCRKGSDVYTMNPNTFVGLRKLTQLMGVASFIYRLNQEGSNMLQREVYYSLKHLFESQDACDNIVYLLGKFAKKKRHELGILPSSKGLLNGPLKFTFDASQEERSYTQADSRTAPEGLLVDSRWISRDSNGLKIVCLSPKPRGIVVVEKEAVFHRLLQCALADDHIVVTGCGFPDIATKAALSRLSHQFSDIPVVGLCDYNPHGVLLLTSFRYFSSPNATFEASGWTTPLRWLGLRNHHVENALELCSEATVCLQALSTRDRAVLNSLMQRPFILENEEYMLELKAMLEGGYKCEIEVLYMLGLDTLKDFVITAINQCDYI